MANPNREGIIGETVMCGVIWGGLVSWRLPSYRPPLQLTKNIASLSPSSCFAIHALDFIPLDPIYKSYVAKSALFWMTLIGVTALRDTTLTNPLTSKDQAYTSIVQRASSKITSVLENNLDHLKRSYALWYPFNFQRLFRLGFSADLSALGSPDHLLYSLNHKSS